VWCQARVKQVHQWFAHAMNETLSTASSDVDEGGRDAAVRWEKPRAVTSAQTPIGRLASSEGLSGLHYLNTGDPQVAMVLRKLQMVRGRDIPIMILGETGTGKDLLAQAVHNDSERANRPFVSVNCASIPETLIESELFGYEEGAFTGARRKGSPGKILQANGGTLFLDEIGDMPSQLQARLLRVLQERRVNPLGSTKEYEVDVTIICATHRNLKELIARGVFREDLYYRLNGLVVKLPALRDRQDFEVVARKILGALCERGNQIEISSEVMALFRRYNWPGNFRQLHNLLRTAVAMVGCEGSIQIHHLPDDFLDEVNDTPIPGRGPESPFSFGAVMQPDALGQPLESTSSTLPFALPADPHKLEDVTLQAMADALRRFRGNVSAAAKVLGVSRNTIYRKKAALPPDVWH
jgi:sigma-54 dependent transcriptional regulator, acetoin dehydrogenase operon transcriptional activator AcoR